MGNNNTNQLVQHDINLVDIWQVLVNKRLLIVTFMFLTIAVSTLYVSSVTPVYKVTVEIMPPTISDISKISEIRGVRGVDLEGVYNLFKQNVDSQGLLKFFFNSKNIAERLRVQEDKASSVEVSFEDFLNNISVNSDIKNHNKILFSLKLYDPKLAVNISNEYLRMINKVTVDKIINDNLDRMTYLLDYKRELAKEYRKNWIVRLEDAVHIARIAEIDTGLPNMTMHQTNNSGANLFNNKELEIIEKTPLYYRGVQALEAEISILKSRKSDDDFAFSLRDLILSIEKLSNIKSSEETLNTILSANIDYVVIPPEKSIYPKTKLIIVLSSIIGLMLGIIVAFLINSVENKRL